MSRGNDRQRRRLLFHAGRRQRGRGREVFVWTPEEVTALLGEEDARLFNRYFDVSETGNFEDHSILHVDEDVDVIARLMKTPRERLAEVVERGRAILFDAREKRVKPYRDEKILTAMEWIDDAELCRGFARVRSERLS